MFAQRILAANRDALIALPAAGIRAEDVVWRRVVVRGRFEAVGCRFRDGRADHRATGSGLVLAGESHGIISGALFLSVGVVYDRMHTREIAAYGGLVNRMPFYAAAFMVFTLANVALPGTSGFIGEFLTLIGTFKVNIWVATLATIGTILSAAYALWLYRKVIFGVIDTPALAAMKDLDYREIITLGPLEESAAMPIIGRGDAWLHFDDAAKQRILFLTGRHPFWLQFLCHRIFERWVLGRVPKVDRAFVDETFAHIIKDPGCRPQFYLLYQEVEKDEFAFGLLRHLAETVKDEGAPVLTSDLTGPWQDKKVLRAALKPLVDNQIVTVENVPQAPAVRFRVEALRRWMRPNLITI